MEVSAISEEITILQVPTKLETEPWLAWLSWLEPPDLVGSIPSQGTYLGCRFDPGPGAYGRQPIDVSLSPFLSF